MAVSVPQAKSLVRARALFALTAWLCLALAALPARPITGLAWSRSGAAEVREAARGLAPFETDGIDHSAILARLKAEQQASVRRSLASLEARFDGYRDRSDAFAQELLRWSTRGSLAWSSMKDVAGGGSMRRRELIRQRFEATVVSERDLKAAVNEALDRLMLELRADRSRALSRIRTHRAASGEGTRERGPSASTLAASLEELDLACERLDAQMDRDLLRQADRSLVMALTGIVGATIATEIVAATVGSAIGGAAVGAAGGSVVPVAGTVIGFAAGMTAGIAVDWWLSERTGHDLAERCRVAIDDLRNRIIDGDDAQGRVGLRKVFESAAAREAAAIETQLQQWMESNR